ncbi:MAG: glycosyltransferase family 4 protein [Methylococcales bacterium]
MLSQVIWLLVAFIAATVGTGLVRRYALAASLLDIPNARSSHQLPTARGGGVAIVIVFLLSLPWLLHLQAISIAFMWALLGAGGLVATIGFLDDHGHIKARWRLLAHFSAAAWGLYCLQGLPALQFFSHTIELGWLGHILAGFYLVWLLNLYNFMDGIDGLAGVEGLSACLGGGLLYLLQSSALPHDYALWMLAVAIAGFLCWNFPPAKIFMGDAGSGFLGIVLGLFSIQAAWVNGQWLWSWLILLAVFIVDASWTLWRRFRRGENLSEAHRSHAYQKAARHYHAHKPVTLAVLAINLCWLLPWALAVALGLVDGFFGMVLAYLPLCWLAYEFRAGEIDQE